MLKMDSNSRMTGLREKPKSEKEEMPYHMTSILKKLFPQNTPRIGLGLVQRNGESAYRIIGKTIKPDFLYEDLGLIIEIDGDSKYREGGHFTSKEIAENDKWKREQYEKLGYKVIAIPPYIQLDSAMIYFYFGLEYSELLYPAAKEHGFAHPNIPLPSSFCKLGLERFVSDMKSIPEVTKIKIIDTLKNRILSYENEGFSKEDALSKVLPPSISDMIR